MKQFLRLQVSGMTFFLWTGIFFVYAHQELLPNLDAYDPSKRTYTFVSVDNDLNHMHDLHITQNENVVHIKVNKTNLIDESLNKHHFKELIELKDTSSTSLELMTFFIVFATLFSLPIGVVIHQISVLLKYLISKTNCARCFSDRPKKKEMTKESTFCPKECGFCNYDPHKKIVVSWHTCRNIKKQYEYDKTTMMEKVSNLNSYYYTRVDNGILSPFFALLFSIVILEISFSKIIVPTLFACGFGLILVLYIPILCQEINKYKKWYK